MDSTEDYDSGWIINQRAATRHHVQRAARLLFTASLSEVKPQTNIEEYSPTLIGHTRDVSLTGLATIIPMVRESDANFYGIEGKLRVTLSIPNSIVNPEAQPVRYQWLDDQDRAKGFLMGLAITGMIEEDRRLYAEYLRTLEG
jgi:hypothetical protein